MSAPIRYPIPRELAEMDRARHQAVEASAGTGKTYLLEHCVADLVLQGATIDQILVVTFTEKATAELRGRVRRLLERIARGEAAEVADGAPAWSIDDGARQRAHEAAQAFDRAPIFTIHGFCHRVLGENAFASRLLFEQSQVASETAFAAAFKAALRCDLARDPAHVELLEQWLKLGKGVSALHKLLYQCARERGALEPPLDEAALRALLDELVVEPIDADEVVGRLRAGGLHAGSAKAVRGVLVRLANSLETYAANRSVIGFLAMDADARAKLEKHGPHVAGLADRDGERMAALLRLMVPLEAAIAQRFVPVVLSRLIADKRRLGQLDFDDMLRLVWEALEGPGGAELAHRLRARYRHALIDEFQDTDEIQWSIFRRLYLEGDDAGRLCIIGDPKQAIYSFRGADVYTYLAARRQMVEAGAGEVPLRDNFRSTPEMVEAFNRLFADRDGDRFFGDDIDYPPVRAAASLRASDAGGAPLTPVQLVQADLGGKVTTPRLREAHLGFLVDELAGLLGDPQRAITLHTRGGERLVTARDVFVLTRSIADADQVAGALRDAGVPCALYKQEGLFHTAEAREVRDLLLGIAEPSARAARLRAWETRFFAPTLVDLAEMGEPPESHPLVTRLDEWHHLAARLDYEALFSDIIARSGVVERELFDGAGERSLTNFLHLFELLLEEVGRSRCEIHELLVRVHGWIEDFEENSADERNIQRLEGTGDAVQVMTIHKSKGLEAPVVYLFGGFAAGGSHGQTHVYHQASQRRVHIGANPPEQCAAEAAAEDQRLLYVALTRASARLYLPYVEPSRKLGVISGLVERLAPIVEAGGEPGFELRRTDGGATVAAAPGRPARWSPPAALLADAPVDPRYAELARSRAGFSVTSYTRLEHQRGAGTPVEAAEEKAGVDVEVADVVADDHRLPGGAAVGIYLHDLLEHVPVDSFAGEPSVDDWAAQPEIERLFHDLSTRHGIDARHLPRSRELVHRAMTTPIDVGDAQVRMADCPRLLREVEFLYPAAGSDVLVKGFIDVVFEHDGRAYVLDWKSDSSARLPAQRAGPPRRGQLPDAGRAVRPGADQDARHRSALRRRRLLLSARAARRSRRRRRGLVRAPDRDRAAPTRSVGGQGGPAMSGRRRRPPLSPRGSARERFLAQRGMAPADDGLAAMFRALAAGGAHKGDLGDETAYLAEEVVGMTSYLGVAERRALAVALVASMIALRQGCTRLPLDGGTSGYLGRIVAALNKDKLLGARTAQILGEIRKLASVMTFDRLIGVAGEDRPLVVEDGHLYQQRVLEAENALVARLRERLAGEATPLPPAGVEVVASVAGSAAHPLSDEQRDAVAAALAGRLIIVTGGPGTGKTSVVASIVRAAWRLGLGADDIALAGPTGKSVNRMTTSLRAALADLPDDDDDDRELAVAALEARTLHRLLGYQPHTRSFRHHANHPLRATLVIVDEASMIDLALMERLLCALRTDARLVLLGDADQLPSVDAGAVLRDLVAALPDHTRRLTRSYRMDPSDPAGRAILRAATRVNDGASPLPSDPDDTPYVRLRELGARAAKLPNLLDDWFREHVLEDPRWNPLRKRTYRATDGRIADDDNADVSELAALFERHRILTITRRLATGADAVNRHLHGRVLAAASADRAPDLYPGEPVVMRSNDYVRGLFNGDQGLILRVDEDGRGQRFRAVFPGPDGWRVFPIDPLRTELELGFAMTVHKSQGSELDHVTVLLPAQDVPLLTREMLYTALTRARRSVTIAGSRKLLETAAGRPTERLSGLADKLRQ